MALQQFDEMNTLKGYIEKWYGDIEMPEDAKKKRMDLCSEYTELMIYVFLLITEQEYSDNEIVDILAERLKIIAENYIGVEELAYINDWSVKEAKSIIERTRKQYQDEIEDFEESEVEETEEETENEEEQTKPKVLHFEEFGVDIPKDEYKTSGFRACLIAIECVTSVANYDDHFQAYRDRRFNKVWMCGHFKDSRETHLEAHGQDTKIDKPFHVGESLLLFPGDITYNPDMQEIYGCKCWCQYY